MIFGNDFEEFLFNVCRNEVKRFEALKSGIGYLLHTYKDPSFSKSIVFIDEKMSEGAFGRSGKGLVIKAISHVRNVVIEDGRNFNPSKNFAFQRVKADTNIIGFEDIREKFCTGSSENKNTTLINNKELNQSNKSPVTNGSLQK